MEGDDPHEAPALHDRGVAHVPLGHHGAKPVGGILGMHDGGHGVHHLAHRGLQQARAHAVEPLEELAQGEDPDQFAAIENDDGADVLPDHGGDRLANGGAGGHAVRPAALAGLVVEDFLDSQRHRDALRDEGQPSDRPRAAGGAPPGREFWCC